MLFTFVLLGIVQSSCLSRNFEQCLSLNVEYQESCQFSQGECKPRPQKCTEIDSTYPLNCKTSECYYSKRFNKCLSQPFTRLLNEFVDRGENHNHQDGPNQGPHAGGPQPSGQGPLPTSQEEPQSPQYPSSQPPSDPIQQNNSSQQDQSEEEETSDISEEEDDSEYQDPQTETEGPSTNNSTNNPQNQNQTNSSGFNDQYSDFTYLIEEEIKAKLSESDERKQIEIKSSGSEQLIMAFIIMINMI